MKIEKEVKMIRVKSENSIVGDNYTEIKLDGALSHKDFKNIANNFAGKKIKLTLEVKEPILDEAERKYLSGVIRPFRDSVKYIRKTDYLDGSEYLSFHMTNEPNWTMPLLKKCTMYKGMELDKEYTLEELEL